MSALPIEPAAPANEPRDTRLRRLRMRSMRRGIKEMDLILQDFAQRRLADMSDADLALYDRLLSENDHDLYAWVAGRARLRANRIFTDEGEPQWR